MKPLNINLLVEEFYSIEAIEAMICSNTYSHFEPMRHSHEKWYKDFSDFRDEFIKRFASAIFDYTVLVVAAELRHCETRATAYIDDYYYSAANSRDDVYLDCIIYDPRNLLQMGVKMFDSKFVNWEDGYGGEKWMQIAKSGLMKDTITDCAFIDHCVDLSHNNSVYFDKGAGIFRMSNMYEYQEFLDKKRYCDLRKLIEYEQGYKLNKLLERANNLNIINFESTPNYLSAERNESESLLFQYTPLIWGNKTLDFSDENLISRELCNDDDEEREYRRCA